MNENALQATEPQPMTLKELAHAILESKDLEGELSRRISKLKENREFLQRQVISLMKDMGVDRTGIDVANMAIQTKKYPQPADWDQIYDYIYQNNAGYLLQRRLSSRAINEVFENGEEVPGISFYEQDELSVTRR